tara:strand:+ start:810 stop:983 length:174 start_codon:yes stop_codon:yes gene_type:complete
MEKLIEYSNIIPAWKAVVWCFYPFLVWICIDFLGSIINDDDDDQGGGQMRPVFQKAQ